MIGSCDFITDYRSWVEIDLDQLKLNYKLYKEKLNPSMGIIAVIKANAYGHGDIVIAKTLEECGVYFFAVSNINEAIRLRNADVRGEILILGYTSSSWAKIIYDLDITQAIISKEHAEEFAKTGYHIKCHFAIDTGMNRIGLDANSPDDCEMTIRKYRSMLNITGIFTHFCAADSDLIEDSQFTLEQAYKFSAITNRIKDIQLKYIHCSNSAAGISKINGVSISKLVNMTRLGIILYGLKPNKDYILPDGIAPVMTWKSTVSMVKHVKQGQTISYGRTYIVTKPSVIATVTTGYADGYNRLLSNHGRVLINGKLARIVGRICMDQLLVDITGIPNVLMGSTVILLGKSGYLEYNANDMANEVDTISYEIVCGISNRVQRIYK